MGYVITCPLPKLYGKLLSYSGALPEVQDRTSGVNDSYDSEKGTNLKDPQLKGKYTNLIKLTQAHSLCFICRESTSLKI